MNAFLLILLVVAVILICAFLGRGKANSIEANAVKSPPQHGKPQPCPVSHFSEFLEVH